MQNENPAISAELFLDAIPIPVFYKDTSGVYLICNLAFSRFIGLDKDKILGKTVYDFNPRHLADMHHQKDEELFKTKTSQSYEGAMVGAIAKERKVMFYKEPILATDGSVTGLAGVIFDITERKIIEERLKETKAELEIRVKVRTAELTRVNEDLHKEIAQRKEAECRLLQEKEKIQKYLDIAGAIIVVIDAQENVALINKNGCDILGYKESEVIGKNWFDTFIPPGRREDLRTVFRELISGRLEYAEYYENPLLNASGEERLIAWHNSLLKDEQGNITATLSSGVDITEQKKAENRLMKLNECLLNFGPDTIENIKQLTAICGELLGATCALYNRIEEGMLCSWGQWNVPAGYNPVSEPEGHICYDVIRNGGSNTIVIHNLPDTKYFLSDSNVKAYGLHTYIGQVVRFGDINIGSLCVVYQRDFVPTDDDKRIMSIIASAIGIEEKRRFVQETLRESQDLYRAIVEDQTEFVSRHLPDGEITFVNDAICRYFGLKREDFLGKNFYEFLPEEERRRVYESISSLSSEKPLVTMEHRIVMSGGERRWHQWTTRAIFDENGRITERQGVGRDITELKEMELERERLNKELDHSNKRLKELALRDTVTGLYNHRYLAEIIEIELYRARRYVHPLSVIMIDIDYFKSINDAYGHQFGDLVLCQLAKLLKAMVRRYDIVVRYAGEEFVIISPSTDRATAITLAQRLLDAVNLYNFGNKKHSVKLKLSMAVSSSPEDKVVKGIDLVETAEEVLDKVKEQGGNNVYSMLDIKSSPRSSRRDSKANEQVRVLEERVDKLNRKAKQSLIEAVFAFAKTIEVKDHYTAEHTERTVKYATEIAKAIKLPKEDIERIKQAAMLHDLGKIGISEEILNKKGPLTKGEMREIKKHPQLGADILRPIQFLHPIIPLILHHHERWDGKGYPSGLKGDEIPVGARVVALADVYHALTTDRPYRKGYSWEQAIEIIKKGSGSQFDPEVVDAFLKIIKQIK